MPNTLTSGHRPEGRGDRTRGPLLTFNYLPVRFADIAGLDRLTVEVKDAGTDAEVIPAGAGQGFIFKVPDSNLLSGPDATYNSVAFDALNVEFTDDAGLNWAIDESLHLRPLAKRWQNFDHDGRKILWL